MTDNTETKITDGHEQAFGKYESAVDITKRFKQAAEIEEMASKGDHENGYHCLLMVANRDSNYPNFENLESKDFIKAEELLNEFATADDGSNSYDGDFSVITDFLKHANGGDADDILQDEQPLMIEFKTPPREDGLGYEEFEDDDEAEEEDSIWTRWQGYEHIEEPDQIHKVRFGMAWGGPNVQLTANYSNGHLSNFAIDWQWASDVGTITTDRNGKYFDESALRAYMEQFIII